MPFGHDVLLCQSFASRKMVENKLRVLHIHRSMWGAVTVSLI